MTLSWERTLRNRTHTTESTHTTKSSYSREPSYSRGYLVHGHGNLLLFWFERQRNFPHLAQFTVGFQSFSPMTTSPRAVDEENTTAYSVKKYYLRNHGLTGSYRGLNTCSWTWQNMTREKARLTRVTKLDFHHQRSIILSQISGAIFAWNMISLGVWVRFR